MGPTKIKIIRCKFYKPDGTPIIRAHGKPGCFRPAADCYYVHPSDPEWGNAAIPKFYMDEEDAIRDRRRSPSPLRRGRSPGRPYHRNSSVDRRPNPGYARRGHSSRSSRRQNGFGPRRDWSPQSTASFDSRHHDGDDDLNTRPPDRHPTLHPRAEQKDDRLLNKTDTLLNISASGSASPIKASASDNMLTMPRGSLPSAPRSMTIAFSNEASRIATSAGSLPSHSRTLLHSAPTPPPLQEAPPPVPASPAMPPPPVWKPIPAGNTSSVPEWMQKETSADEMRAIWAERIGLIAQVISERTAFHTSERDIQQARRVVQSFRFEGTGGGEDVTSALASHVQSGESRRVDRRHEIISLTTKLLESNFWPILPPYDVQGFQGKCTEMKDTIAGLRDHVTQLQDLMKKVLWQHLQRQGVSLPSLDPTSSTAVVAEGDARPANGQRTSESVELGHGPFVISSEDTAALPELEQAIRNIQERVDKVEASVGDIHNDITQHAQHTIDDIDSKLEAIIEDIKGNADSLATPEQIAASEPAKRLGEVGGTVKSVEDDLNELVTEVTGLITGSSEAEVDRVRLRRENEELKQKLAQLEQTELANKDILAQIRQENDALTKAIALRLNKPPAPPMLPSNEVIMMALELPIRRTLRSEMAPVLEELTATILEVLQAHSEDIRGPLINQILTNRRAADVITAWIEKMDRAGLDQLRTMIAQASA